MLTTAQRIQRRLLWPPIGPRPTNPPRGHAHARRQTCAANKRLARLPVAHASMLHTSLPPTTLRYDTPPDFVLRTATMPRSSIAKLAQSTSAWLAFMPRPAHLHRISALACAFCRRQTLLYKSHDCRETRAIQHVTFASVTKFTQPGTQEIPPLER
jgi:hypothetical protein